MTSESLQMEHLTTAAPWQTCVDGDNRTFRRKEHAASSHEFGHLSHLRFCVCFTRYEKYKGHLGNCLRVKSWRLMFTSKATGVPQALRTIDTFRYSKKLSSCSKCFSPQALNCMLLRWMFCKGASSLTRQSLKLSIGICRAAVRSLTSQSVQ